MPLMIWLTALTVLFPTYNQAQVPPPVAALAEPGETRANEIQPPDLVMDLLGIRPGLIIGEVGAGRPAGNVP